MKLLICKICNSVFNLTNKSKSCECGKTTSLLNAIELQEFLNKIEKDNPKVCCKGEEFIAFTIPEWADTITKEK